MSAKFGKPFSTAGAVAREIDEHGQRRALAAKDAAKSARRSLPSFTSQTKAKTRKGMAERRQRNDQKIEAAHTGPISSAGMRPARQTR